jgi:hypothetical protein
VLTDALAIKPRIAATLILFIIAALSACVLIAHPSFAAKVTDCTASNGQPGVKTAIGVNGSNCVPVGGNTLESNPIMVYLFGVLKIISGLVGLAAVGGFVWGGILYITARANAGQVEKAKLVMINATLGIILFVFMYAILNFIIPGGFFSG